MPSIEVHGMQGSAPVRIVQVKFVAFFIDMYPLVIDKVKLSSKKMYTHTVTYFEIYTLSLKIREKG